MPLPAIGFGATAAGICDAATEGVAFFPPVLTAIGDKVSILTFAMHVRDRISRRRIYIVPLLLLGIAARTQAADFTIGGSISNLAGNGLVLSLDAQAACIASGNISAVTNSPAAGGAEQCLITATNQCCSLSSFNGQSTTNPDGTFNCTVTCGSVIGRPATLHLPQALAASQTVSPPANATAYTFGTAIPDGSTFTVAVDTQPSSPAQLCTVANATGTVSGANVTNVNVTCTTVTHTVTATAGPNGSALPASQSVDDGSTAIVTLSPAMGFTGSASGCGGCLGGDGVTYTTGPITADCTVAATFAAIPLSPTTTTLSLSPNPVLVGQPLTASVTVSNAAMRPDRSTSVSAVPTGTVSVEGGGQSCNAILSNGTGSCTLVYAATGAFTVTATYQGDAQNLPSSTTAALTVAAPARVVSTPALGGLALVMLVLCIVALAWRRRVTR
jgi:hypothetical protein